MLSPNPWQALPRCLLYWATGFLTLFNFYYLNGNLNHPVQPVAAILDESEPVEASGRCASSRGPFLQPSEARARGLTLWTGRPSSERLCAFTEVTQLDEQSWAGLQVPSWGPQK